MKIKVLTINVWRYYKWENRKKKVINFLKEKDADIIFFQEAAYDERLKNKWQNQIEEINQRVQYPNLGFKKLMGMEKWHGKPIEWTMCYGFGLLSKYPIKHSEVIILPPVEKNKNFGFMYIIIKTTNGNINLINVHFENTNEGSKEHLRQTLEWCKKRGIKPIIAGDFNIKSIDDLKEVVDEDYEISYSIKPYKSFVPTKFSHNKTPITLDYIIVNKSKYRMTKVECKNSDISDHNPVIAEIEII